MIFKGNNLNALTIIFKLTAKKTKDEWKRKKTMTLHWNRWKYKYRFMTHMNNFFLSNVYVFLIFIYLSLSPSFFIPKCKYYYLQSNEFSLSIHSKLFYFLISLNILSCKSKSFSDSRDSRLLDTHSTCFFFLLSIINLTINQKPKKNGEVNRNKKKLMF